MRTAFTSTADRGEMVSGGAVGAAVAGTEPVDAVGTAAVGIEATDAVAGAAEAGVPADGAVACPKTLDIRLANIPIRIDLVKDK